MSSRRRYVIKISKFYLTKSFTLFKSIIPTILQFSWRYSIIKGVSKGDFDDYDVMTSRNHNVIEIDHHFYFLLCALVQSMISQNFGLDILTNKKVYCFANLCSKMT